MTSFSEARRSAVLRLREAGIDSPGTEADLLLSGATGLSRAALLVHLPDAMEDDLYDEFMKMVKRRCVREPIQYILRSWEFYGHTLEVQPGVLIPFMIKHDHKTPARL